MRAVSDLHHQQIVFVPERTVTIFMLEHSQFGS
jgi:hypothetical protein